MKKMLWTAAAILVAAAMVAAPAFAGGAKEAKPAEKFVIKMATPSNPQDSCVKAFFHFKEIVERDSKGRVEVQVA